MGLALFIRIFWRTQFLQAAISPHHQGVERVTRHLPLCCALCATNLPATNNKQASNPLELGGAQLGVSLRYRICVSLTYVKLCPSRCPRMKDPLSFCGAFEALTLFTLFVPVCAVCRPAQNQPCCLGLPNAQCTCQVGWCRAGDAPW